jgi:TolA-binding protein
MASVLSFACSGCQQRQREIDTLRAHVADLQGQVQQLQRQLQQSQRDQKRQAAPFRRRHLVPRPKKPGRPQGYVFTVILEISRRARMAGGADRRHREAVL